MKSFPHTRLWLMLAMMLMPTFAYAQTTVEPALIDSAFAPGLITVTARVNVKFLLQ